ncbi:MAG: hypothetical protein AAGD11_02185 [Planctomycetota bacterium]
MQKIEANWEDEENNRKVSVDVEYTRKEDTIEIKSLTPKQVTFLCPESNNPLRSVGVWTDKGRELLAKQLHAAGCLPQLEEEIEASLAV